jgi:hypothetical protein
MLTPGAASGAPTTEKAKAADHGRSFALLTRAQQASAPTTEKAKAKTQSYGGLVVNRGPYDCPHPKTGFGITAETPDSVLLLFVVVIVAVGHFWCVEF